MPEVAPLIVGKGITEASMLPGFANRHGLIAGATGTGKTITLRILLEEFSRIGVPVFVSDIKGDLSGIAKAGGENPKVSERITTLGIQNFQYRGFPTTFWDIYGERGHPIRTTISEIGPILLSRILDLNDTQSGVLSIIFKIADDNRMLLLDLKDLQAMIRYAADNASELKSGYGNISTASTGAIQRSLLTLEEQGASLFFGEPALDINNFIATTNDGTGIINILAADRLYQSPKLYATFLLWLLSELFEVLPEIGDPEKPKLVFFFDEAHLLFQDSSQKLEEKIIQIVRLIRSKGVGIYFITQNPSDIPDAVLGQLGNRIQHALRAFTPKDEKAVRTAARTMRQNPEIDTEKVITELGIGEALISFLDRQGTPSVVDRVMIMPPKSRLTPLTPEERKEIIMHSSLAGKYETPMDRESAYELLTKKAESFPEQEIREETKKKNTHPATKKPRGSDTGDILGDVAMTTAKTIGRQIGKELMRGVLGSLTGSKRK